MPGPNNPIKIMEIIQLRQLQTDDEISDFFTLEREILILIAKWTDPDHPEGRIPYSRTPINADNVNKLDAMLNAKEGDPELPEEVQDELLKITSSLFTIIETINDPKDPIWETNPHPYS